MFDVFQTTVHIYVYMYILYNQNLELEKAIIYVKY